MRRFVNGSIRLGSVTSIRYSTWSPTVCRMADGQWKVSHTVLRIPVCPILHIDIGSPTFTRTLQRPDRGHGRSNVLSVCLEGHTDFRAKECMTRVWLVVLPASEAEDCWESLAFELAVYCTVVPPPGGNGADKRKPWKRNFDSIGLLFKRSCSKLGKGLVVLKPVSE